MSAVKFSPDFPLRSGLPSQIAPSFCRCFPVLIKKPFSSNGLPNLMAQVSLYYRIFFINVFLVAVDSSFSLMIVSLVSSRPRNSFSYRMLLIEEGKAGDRCEGIFPEAVHPLAGNFTFSLDRDSFAVFQSSFLIFLRDAKLFQTSSLLERYVNVFFCLMFCVK